MQRPIITSAFLLLIMLHSCSIMEPVPETNTEARTKHLFELEESFQGSGVFYSLPRTAITVDVEVKKTTKIPGPYAGYAGRFLGLDNVIRSHSNDYEIARVSISGFSEPDPEHIYFIKYNDHDAHKLSLTLNEAGLIISVNSDPKNQEALISHENSKDLGHYSRDATFNHFIDSNLMERIDTIIEHIREDTIMVQRQTLRRSWVEKSTEHRAREVADYILEIREKKFDLISGFQEIPYSKEALEYMYREMNRLENDYLDLFTGITSYKILRYRYIHRPLKEDANEGHILFYFSTKEGVLPAKKDDGIPVELSYKRSSATHLIDRQISRLTKSDDARPAGVYYRIPEYTDISLLLGNETRAQARMLVNQFGIVTYLPANNMEVEFYPNTGSIRLINIQEQ